MGRTDNRTRLPADLRRKQIAVAARHVFAVWGLAGAKTRQIAEAADVTETILYRHFSSKEEIFEAAILEPVEQLATDLMRLTAEFSRIDPKRRLELSQQVHDEIRRVVEEITPLLGVALFSSRETGRRFYRDRLVPLFDLAANAIGQAMAPKQQKVMEPRVMLLVLVGMYLGVSLEALFADRVVDWDGVTRDLTEVVAFGLFSAA
ncbi:MAG TPA: TetR/AcrR family transcriptional regulator [Acidimicrobiia bacterium]|nr:TetR/AcrR family transcriptional regulator [Acidimicrobiia bacterium]